jgi:hypothetical protein
MAPVALCISEQLCKLCVILLLITALYYGLKKKPRISKQTERPTEIELA